MFGLIIGLLTDLFNASNQPSLINLHPNEYSQ